MDGKGNVSRRTALGVLGAAGTAAIAAAQDLPPLQPNGPFPSGPVPLPALPPGYDSDPMSAVRLGVRGRMTGALAAAEALALEGTRCVFGIPGAQSNEFWDAMKTKGVPYLLATNEMSVSVMADGAARATGEVGVFSVVPGPGLTNAMTGIGEAFLDSVPIVGIVTDVDRGGSAPAFQVHSLPGASLAKPISKAVLEVRNVGQIPTMIHRAFQTARSGEPGPVMVVIPYSFFNKVFDYEEKVPPPPPPHLDRPAYGQALEMLSNPRCRVGIYAGMGCFGATSSLRAVAETLQAPVATSVSGKGAIADSHPLAVGWGYGRFGTIAAETVFRDVDVLLAVGVRYSEVSTANYAIPKHDKVIHVDANPDNAGRNIKADVKVVGDARLFFDQLLADADAIRRPPYPALWRQIADLRAADRSCYDQIMIQAAVDPMLFLYRMRRLAACDALVFVDVTASTHWASEAIDVPGPRHYFTPADNQSMGWTIPAAIGAQQVRRDRQVLAVVGDGCFLMSALEMSTAAREGLPVKFFVFEDGAYHYMQMLQKPLFRRTTATELAKIDYRAFAQAMGLGYLEINGNAEIDGGLAAALSYPGPLLTQVRISYEGRPIRWLSAVKSTYLDKMSTPQKLRTATRVASRSANPIKVND